MAVLRTHGPASSRRVTPTHILTSKIPLVGIQSIRACVQASSRYQQPLLQARNAQFASPLSSGCSIFATCRHLKSPNTLGPVCSIRGREEARQPCHLRSGEISSNSRFVTGRPSPQHASPHKRSSSSLRCLASLRWQPSAVRYEKQQTVLNLQTNASSLAPHLKGTPILLARDAIRCCSNITGASSATSSSSVTSHSSSSASSGDVVATPVIDTQQPAAAPLDWAVEVCGWRVRTFRPEDLPQVIDLQATSFHEASSPVGAVNDFTFRMFEAEVVDAMQCKLRYNKRDQFTMLVIEERDPTYQHAETQTSNSPTLQADSNNSTNNDSQSIGTEASGGIHSRSSDETSNNSSSSSRDSISSSGRGSVVEFPGVVLPPSFTLLKNGVEAEQSSQMTTMVPVSGADSLCAGFVSGDSSSSSSATAADNSDTHPHAQSNLPSRSREEVPVPALVTDPPPAPARKIIGVVELSIMRDFDLLDHLRKRTLASPVTTSLPIQHPFSTATSNTNSPTNSYSSNSNSAADDCTSAAEASVPITRYVYLSSMAVASAARRQGVAQALLTGAELQCHLWQVQDLLLHVYKDNTKAVALYQKTGHQLLHKDPSWRAWLGERLRLLMCKRMPNLSHKSGS